MELLSIHQAATILGLSQRRVRQFCEEGRFGQRVGPFKDRWGITLAELKRFQAKTRPAHRPGKASR